MAQRSTKDSKEQIRLKGLVKELLKLPQNRFCSECGQARPSWASVNLGVFVCINCSGFHRNLGVHISKVRSTTMDNWTQEFYDFISTMGNEKANAYWEAKLPEHRKPGPNDTTQVIDGFIKEKYVRKAWIKKGGEAPTLENWLKAGGNNGANGAGVSPQPSPPAGDASDEESDEDDAEREKEREKEKEKEKARKAAKKNKKKQSAPSSPASQKAPSPEPEPVPVRQEKQKPEKQKQENSGDDLLDFGSASGAKADAGFEGFFADAAPKGRPAAVPAAPAGAPAAGGALFGGAFAAPAKPASNDIMAMFSQPQAQPPFTPRMSASMYTPAPLPGPMYTPAPVYPAAQMYPPMYVPQYSGFPAPMPYVASAMVPPMGMSQAAAGKKVSSTSDVMAMF